MEWMEVNQHRAELSVFVIQEKGDGLECSIEKCGFKKINRRSGDEIVDNVEFEEITCKSLVGK